MNKVHLTKAVAVTLEVCGASASDAAIEMMVRTLAEHDPKGVLVALERCQREITGRLSLAQIISRIPDEWPTPDEAWSICPSSEYESAVWTDEIAQCFEAVRNMSDRVAARRAFIDAYSKRLVERRSARAKPRWWVSFGYDVGGRESAVLFAVEQNRLTPGEARSLVPELPPFPGEYPQLDSGETPEFRQLADGVAEKVTR